MSALSPESWHPLMQMGVLWVGGLCVGSFLNVVIVRVPRGESIRLPSSRCGTCRSSLAWWMNIPVFSFLLTGGCCLHCGMAYSSRYPVVEALTAVLFFSVWTIHGWTFTSLLFCSFSAALLAITFIDLEFRIIPDSLSIGGWLIALALAALSIPGYPIDFVSSVVGSLVGFGSFWLLGRLYYWLTYREGLGGGDVKLMGFIGAVIGIQGVVTTILVGSIAGTISAGVYMAFFKKTRHYPIPFGPYLAIGALIVVFGLDRIFWP